MAAFTQMYMNNPLVLNQNTSLYGQMLDDGTDDYLFIVNIASVVGPDITNLFNASTFIQNQQNADYYDVNLTIDSSSVFANWNLFNQQDLVTVSPCCSTVAFGTFKTISENLGDRLLEVVAHKIFGHAQARAAINNDDQFYTHDGTIWDHLTNTVAMNNIRNDIFNQYVAMGRYNTFSNTSGGVNPQTNQFDDNNEFNDVDQNVQFNFIGLTFDYKMWVAGSLILDDSISQNEVNIIQNGPAVGGSTLSMGQYNVPVLVRFTC